MARPTAGLNSNEFLAKKERHGKLCPNPAQLVGSRAFFIRIRGKQTARFG